MVENYTGKFLRMQGETLYPQLSVEERDFIQTLAAQYLFSFQDLKSTAEFANDLAMWGEGTFADLWRRLEQGLPHVSGENPKQRKKKILRLLDAERVNLCRQEKDYSHFPGNYLCRQKNELVNDDSAKVLYGDCPVCSDKTVCCGLKTIDAVENCGFACSYCTIQTFYGEGQKIKFAADLKQKLRSIKLDKEKFYHFGTGQSSDSLMWGNHNGLLDDLCEFAADNPNILLEFKTKSANVEYFKTHSVPKNILCSWTLNTETIVRNEEHLTASLEERLRAARLVADCGIKVAFHFHPMVYYLNWQKEYSELAEKVIAMFNPSEVHFISYGTLTFIKPVIRQIRKRAAKTKILQMEMVTDPHDKLTYPDHIKLKLFRTLDSVFRDWHDQVFFYLCMERAEIWDALWGWHFTDRTDFLEHFKV